LFRLLGLTADNIAFKAKQNGCHATCRALHNAVGQFPNRFMGTIAFDLS
jgi:hypothetical protein